MGREIKLIFIAFIVDFSSIHVQPYGKIDQASTIQLNDEGKYWKLLNSVSKNNENSEKYREFLKQEVVVGLQAFDLMKNQFRIAQARNSHKRANAYGRNNVNEDVVARKREANANNTCSAKQHEDEEASSDLNLYQQVLNLTMELLRKQKIHIENIKERCDWLGKSGIILKKLPQILFHASEFFDVETNTRKEILDDDPGGHKKINPYSQEFVAQMENFLTDIGKFVDVQTKLTRDEVSSIKNELTTAREELKTAGKVIDEKVRKLDKFLAF